MALCNIGDSKIENIETLANSVRTTYTELGTVGDNAQDKLVALGDSYLACISDESGSVYLILGGKTCSTRWAASHHLKLHHRGAAFQCGQHILARVPKVHKAIAVDNRSIHLIGSIRILSWQIRYGAKRRAVHFRGRHKILPTGVLCTDINLLPRIYIDIQSFLPWSRSYPVLGDQRCGTYRDIRVARCLPSGKISKDLLWPQGNIEDL